MSLRLGKGVLFLSGSFGGQRRFERLKLVLWFDTGCLSRGGVRAMRQGCSTALLQGLEHHLHPPPLQT